jgi:hypothetical protein
VVVLGLAVAVGAGGCGGASSGSAGAEEGGGHTPRHRSHADTEGCPNGCFLSEGRCMTVPEGEPEELRGDELPVVEPVPCEPRCCEDS